MTISSAFQSPNVSAMFTAFPPIKETQGRDGKWDPLLPTENPGSQQAFDTLSLRDPARLALLEASKQTPAGARNTWHKVKVLPASDGFVNTVKNPAVLVSHYLDLIHYHVEVRTALFFQQAISCFNTPFHFEIAHTDKQFFSAKTLKVQGPSGSSATCQYQAAHISTLPGLKACLRADFEAHEPGGAAPTYFAFLEDSHLDRFNNSTTSLPISVNQIDTLIDGKSSETTKLRGWTIALINEVAKARLNPIDATRAFLAGFKDKLQTCPENSKTMTVAKRWVIQTYLDTVERMTVHAAVSEYIQGRHPFFDGLLDVNVTRDNPVDVPKIREIVYSRKYEIIRESRFTESKIYLVMHTCFPQFNEQSMHTLKLCLVLMTENDPIVHRVFEKLFCVSLQALKSNPTLVAGLQTEIVRFQPALQYLLREVRQIVRNFNKLEHCFKATLLRNFRKGLRNLTQAQLSQRMVTVIDQRRIAELQSPQPNHALIGRLNSTATSVPTISRLENDRVHFTGAYSTPENQRFKALTVETANIICNALGIQPGHFFCAFSLSNET